MSSHPGSELSDAIELALYLKKLGLNPEQVQDFYPTPGTASTVMYYTGINPLDMKRVYAPDDYREKLMQRALLQYRKPENWNLVREALTLAGREDLIGFGGDCLVKPDMRVGSDYYNKNLKNWQNPRKNQGKHGADGKERKNVKEAKKPSKPQKSEKKLQENKNIKNAKNAHGVGKNEKKPTARRKK